MSIYLNIGIVHAVYELYGSELTGRILNSFGRLFTFYLQDAGQSCGIESLTLTSQADHNRQQLLNKLIDVSAVGFQAFSKGESVLDSIKELEKQPNLVPTITDIHQSETMIANMFATDKRNTKIRLDGAMQSVINQTASDVIKACLPDGLERPFLKNDFSMMVLTGAKGSMVNQSQISCFLGQQALEGLRVPIMISGKTLPSFRPYDSSPRSGIYIDYVHIVCE